MLKIVKTYPPRGPMQQFRLAETSAFTCFRCGDVKKAKLHTVFNGEWSLRLCNGCYGRLLSIHEIKAGTAADDAKADALASELLRLASEQQARERLLLLNIAGDRAEHLTALTLRFIGTAEHVAHSLGTAPSLDWSPAVIGLCKAVELEIGTKVIDRLRAACEGVDLSGDAKDRDLGRVAGYCAGRVDKPPELGSFRHFLVTASNSRSRAETSSLLRAWGALLRSWPGADWLGGSAGLSAALATLTSEYRNRAAHVDALGPDEYARCRDLVVGDAGILWRIIQATGTRR